MQLIDFILRHASRVFMDSKEQANKLVAVVRVRGTVNVRKDITETLNRLHLKAPNNCVVLKMTDSYRGMLNRCVNHVAYGEVDRPVLEKLLARNASDLKADEIMSGTYDAAKLKEQMPFRLHPPRHGYGDTKLSFRQGGVLGYMGADINKLLNRMV